MESQFIKSGYGGVEVHVGLKFHSYIDYDRRALRRAMAKGAGIVRQEARRLVSNKAISQAGQFPGMNTGVLKRAIGVVSKGTHGGWIKVGVKKTAKMQDFYPAFLFYGVKKLGKIQRLAPGEGHGRSNRRGRGERAALIEERKNTGEFFVAPRGNYMTEAMQAKRESVQAVIRAALKDALVPR